MKTLITGVCIFSTLFLMGCAEPKTETKTVLAPGACSQETIDAYTNIFKLANTKDKVILQTLTDISKSCAVYNNGVGSGSCKVIDTNTGNVTDVSSADVEPVCTKVSALLKTKAPGTSVDQLKKGLILKVKNENLMNQLIKDGNKSVVHDGQVTAATTPIASDFCTISAKRRSYETRDGDSVKLSQISQTGQVNVVLKISSADKNLMINCYHAILSKDWTVENLKTIFGDLADIQILN